MPKLISREQSAYVRGREIVDNTILAQELIHDTASSNRGSNIAIKLDMAKAYDRLDWQYLLWVLRRFGFDNKFIDIIWGNI
ncbi:uncharacterized protein M6B38_131310 [Iris pallida]|uniref:Reverse transcriptase domain-containing protein n=1 Tax=Iris pallida TaxID=29817 RepID=A0AAX6G0U8_IRIPA|nr:uncharacterized protein M6B38_131310 [Iris pallida]